MPLHPTLKGPAVTLRQPRPGDRNDRLALGQSPQILHMFGFDTADAQPLTAAGIQHWLDALASHPHAWVIEHDRRLLGEIRLDALDSYDRRAPLAIGLDDPAKLGIGLGREAIGLLLPHAFGALGLHRISVLVIAYNICAIRCYRACGFIEEGREREAALVGGAWHDDVMMGLLVHEFRDHGGCQGLRSSTYRWLPCRPAASRSAFSDPPSPRLAFPRHLRHIPRAARPARSQGGCGNSHAGRLP